MAKIVSAKKPIPPQGIFNRVKSSIKNPATKRTALVGGVLTLAEVGLHSIDPAFASAWEFALTLPVTFGLGRASFSIWKPKTIEVLSEEVEVLSEEVKEFPKEVGTLEEMLGLKPTEFYKREFYPIKDNQLGLDAHESTLEEELNTIEGLINPEEGKAKPPKKVLAMLESRAKELQNELQWTNNIKELISIMDEVRGKPQEIKNRKKDISTLENELGINLFNEAKKIFDDLDITDTPKFVLLDYKCEHSLVELKQKLGNFEELLPETEKIINEQKTALRILKEFIGEQKEELKLKESPDNIQKNSDNIQKAREKREKFAEKLKENIGWIKQKLYPGEEIPQITEEVIKLEEELPQPQTKEQILADFDEIDKDVETDPKKIKEKYDREIGTLFDDDEGPDKLGGVDASNLIGLIEEIGITIKAEKKFETEKGKIRDQKIEEINESFRLKKLGEEDKNELVAKVWERFNAKKQEFEEEINNRIKIITDSVNEQIAELENKIKEIGTKPSKPADFASIQMNASKATREVKKGIQKLAKRELYGKEDYESIFGDFNEVENIINQAKEGPEAPLRIPKVKGGWRADRRSIYTFIIKNKLLELGIEPGEGFLSRIPSSLLEFHPAVSFEINRMRQEQEIFASASDPRIILLIARGLSVHLKALYKEKDRDRFIEIANSYNFDLVEQVGNLMQTLLYPEARKKVPTVEEQEIIEELLPLSDRDKFDMEAALELLEGNSELIRRQIRPIDTIAKPEKPPKEEKLVETGAPVVPPFEEEVYDDKTRVGKQKKPKEAPLLAGVSEAKLIKDQQRQIRLLEQNLAQEQARADGLEKRLTEALDKKEDIEAKYLHSEIGDAHKRIKELEEEKDNKESKISNLILEKGKMERKILELKKLETIVLELKSILEGGIITPEKISLIKDNVKSEEIQKLLELIIETLNLQDVEEIKHEKEELKEVVLRFAKVTNKFEKTEKALETLFSLLKTESEIKPEDFKDIEVEGFQGVLGLVLQKIKDYKTLQAQVAEKDKKIEEYQPMVDEFSALKEIEEDYNKIVEMLKNYSKDPEAKEKLIKLLEDKEAAKIVGKLISRFSKLTDTINTREAELATKESELAAKEKELAFVKKQLQDREDDSRADNLLESLEITEEGKEEEE